MPHELPAHPDLDWYRKQAKDLLDAFARGDEEAIERVRRPEGRRAPERFVLGDAQWVIASELGYRSWAELKRLVERRRREASGSGGHFAALAAAFEAARATWGERGDVRLDSGLSYGGTRPVEVLARRRPGQYSFSDGAGGVDAAGRPRGWLEAARRVVEEHGMNMNLRGVVFMSAVERRDAAWLHSIAARVADASLAVYQALLDLDEERPARAARQPRLPARSDRRRRAAPNAP
jgi:hypothetical protein